MDLTKRTPERRLLDKNNKNFKLYINRANSRVWTVLDTMEQEGINLSDFICQCVLETYDNLKGKTVEEYVKRDQERDPLKRLLTLASEYENHGFQGKDLDHIIPERYMDGSISREQMIDLIVFSMKLHTIMTKTDTIDDYLKNNANFVMQTKKDIHSLAKTVDLKQKLEKLLTTPDNIIQARKRAQEINERQEKADQAHFKARIEMAKWKKANPDKEEWMKDKTEEEIQKFLTWREEMKYVPGSGYYTGGDEELYEV